MKWSVLVDNRTSNPALGTEHGLSILLETERLRWENIFRHSAADINTPVLQLRILQHPFHEDIYINKTANR